jgi:hypothetical protein
VILKWHRYFLCLVPPPQKTPLVPSQKTQEPIVAIKSYRSVEEMFSLFTYNGGIPEVVFILSFASFKRSHISDAKRCLSTPVDIELKWC